MRVMLQSLHPAEFIAVAMPRRGAPVDVLLEVKTSMFSRGGIQCPCALLVTGVQCYARASPTVAPVCSVNVHSLYFSDMSPYFICVLPLSYVALTRLSHVALACNRYRGEGRRYHDEGRKYHY